MKAYTARSIITEKVENLFLAELANERDGGVSPSTISSALDSISQAPEIMCEGWEMSDWIVLLQIAEGVGFDAELAWLVE